MRNRNLWVLIVAILMIAAVAVLALVVPQRRNLSADAPVLSTSTPQAAQTAAPEAVQTVEATSEPTVTVEPQPTAVTPADAYLLVTVKGTLYEPIPLYSEGSYSIHQPDSGAENVIHVTPNSVYMQSSTCDNQDCVLQGTVTLENMSERVLGNMIICLPNEVTLELYTPEGLVSLLTQMQ